jgi:nucleoid-associated protein YgaU
MAKSVYSRLGYSTLTTGSSNTSRSHVVTAGEKISDVAFFEYMNAGYSSELWRQIAEYNGVDDLDNLPANSVLVIPSPKGV